MGRGRCANCCGIAIHQNIHELRTGRKSVDLFHVAFKEV